MPYTIVALDSDKDTHFSGIIATNAIENESIDFPSDFKNAGIQKIFIHQISLQSEQNLDWDFIFWSSKDFADTSDLDADSFIIGIDSVMDAGDAVRIAGANQYYYTYEPTQPIAYTDKDNTSKLHVGLLDRHGTNKLASDNGGAVKIRFMVEPVL